MDIFNIWNEDCTGTKLSFVFCPFIYIIYIGIIMLLTCNRDEISLRIYPDTNIVNGVTETLSINLYVVIRETILLY